MTKTITAILILVCVCSFPVAAQSLAGLGAINGSVRDASGAVIPAAKVIVANPNTGVRRELSTNEAGLFYAPSLNPTTGYEVTVTKEGFAQYDAKQIQVQVGQNITLNIILDVKTQVQELTINDSTPIVDQLKTGVSQVVDDKQIVNLPINGRRADSFVLLTPGVTNDGQFGLVTFRGTPGGNAFLTDGNDTTQGYYNENAGRTRISSSISQDAVQEFQVQSSGFSAEFGRSVGGSVNTVTRSGSNSVHGTAYWFFRNQDFNATDRYSILNGKGYNPPEKRNQFGASVGGPIKTDKVFYFFNYDGTRRNFPLVSTINNTQLFNSSGQFIGACGAPATPAQCANAVAYFNRFFTQIPRTADQDAYFGKLDFRPSDKHALSASFNLMNWVSPNGIQTQGTRTDAGGLGNNGDSSVRHRFARLAHTFIASPSVVNEFRFGWFKDRLYDTFNAELAPPNGLIGQLSVQGQGNLGVANFLPRVQPTEDRFQFANNLTWLTGRHNYKFGFDIAHTKDIVELLSNGRGTYSYGTVTAFAQDLTNVDGGKRWQNYSQTFGNDFLDIFVRDFNFFAQDQWKISQRFTLNYGVRYEYAQFAQPTESNPSYPQTAKINQPNMNFAPRIGFAFGLDKSGKTVLRSSYGIFFARMPGSTVGNLHQNNAVTQIPITLNGTRAAELAAGPSFPTLLPEFNSSLPRSSVSLGFADPDLSTPYTQQWDLGIERELARDMGITISYLGSRGIGFFMTRDLNAGALGPDVTYRINDRSGQQVGSYTTPTYRFANRIDRNYLRVTQLENAGNTWYNAMVVQFRKRAGRWGQGTVAYTLSKSIDYNQGGGNSNLFISSDGLRTIFNGDFKGQRTISELDQRHRLVMTGLLTPPDFKVGRAAGMIVNGWNLSLIGTIASTQYSTPVLQISGSPFSGAAFNTSLNGFGGDNRVPWLTRSSLPIDNIGRLDARLTKALKFTERYQLMLTFEAFNVFNNISDTTINTRAYQLTGTALNPINGLGTGSASLGFPDGTNARRAQVGARFVF